MLGSIVSWLLAPNNIVLPALASLAVVVWRKLRGDTMAAWTDIVQGAASSLAQEAVTQWVPGGTLADGLAFVRAYIEREVWGVLEKRGVPRTGLTEALVHGAVEVSTSDLANVLAAKLLPSQVAAMSDRASDVRAAFAVDPNSALARIGADLRAMVDVAPVKE